MTKTARPKTERRKRTATPVDLHDGNGAVTVSEHEIARRAFEFYCARGFEHGHDLEDWLLAERELRATH
jgi:hypothetical protein